MKPETQIRMLTEVLDAIGYTVEWYDGKVSWKAKPGQHPQNELTLNIKFLNTPPASENRILKALLGLETRLMATLDERFDALTAKGEKIFTEVAAVKQALADLRAAPGTLTPVQEEKLVAAEAALQRIDDQNEDGVAP